MSSNQTASTTHALRGFGGRIAGRLLRSLLTLWAVLTLTFLVGNVLPADPARIVAGPQARPADIARIRTEMGLDAPVATRYARFLARTVHIGGAGSHTDCAKLGALHADLGRSYTQRRPVLTVVLERLPRTLLIAALALLFQLLFGIGAGTAGAYYAGSWVERSLTRASLLTLSVPTFLIGLALQWLFAHQLHWLPLDGYGKTILDQARSAILPSLTLGIYGFAYYARITRDEVARELKSDYIRTARAKGASERRVLFVHALRNAQVALVTLATMDFAALLAGAAVTESLFRYPGLGQLAASALFERDTPMLLGSVLVTATAVVAASALADTLTVVLDPRTRTRR